MTVRDDVVTVLDGMQLQLPDGTVTIRAFRALPPTIDAWTAWVVWGFTIWRTVAIADDSWTVLLALPAADADAFSTAGEVAKEPVRQQLMKVGGVMRCEPIALSVGDNATTVPALAYTLET